jgi:hypothetical protein
MVFSMTNRLLLMVITFALTSGVVAHAAQAPERPLAPITLPAASSLPMALQTAASHISETATAAIDPSAAIRGASLRDHVALEHLRQAAAVQLTGRRPAFDQLISTDEAALTEIERTALATTRPAVSSSIAAMDAVVASAEAELNRQLSQAAAVKSAARASQPQITTPGKQLATTSGKQVAATSARQIAAAPVKSGTGASSGKSGTGASSGKSGSGDSSAKSGSGDSSGKSRGDSSGRSQGGDSSGGSRGGDSSEHSHGE